MWISKKKYNELQHLIKKNEDGADSYRRLISELDFLYDNKILIINDCAIMKCKHLNKILEDNNSEKDKIKDIKAELEWYKIKYYELKNGIKS